VRRRPPPARWQVRNAPTRLGAENSRCQGRSSAGLVLIAGVATLIAVSVVVLPPDAEGVKDDADDRDDGQDDEKRIGHRKDIMHDADGTIVRGCAI